MKSLWLPLFGLILGSSMLLAADDEGSPKKEAAKEAPAKNSNIKPIDKASYGIGLNIGKNLKRDELGLNTELLVQGIRDALSDAKPKLSDKEIEEAFGIVQAEIQKRELAKKLAETEKNKKIGDEYLAANAKKEGVQKTKSGLQYQVIKEGKGAKPKETDTVRVHYHGTLTDGTVFDSSVKRGEPATFPVNGVIKGWVEILQLMPVGSKWRVVIPSDLAYGPRGAGGKIGPHAVLTFEIELLAIEKPQE